MLDYARWYFERALSEAGGPSTDSAHLRHAAKARGLDLDVGELEPDFPDLAIHIWAWFLDLHAARGGGGMGPAGITYEAILSYQRVMGTIIRPWEARALKAIDGAYLAVVAETQEERRKRRERERRAQATARR